MPIITKKRGLLQKSMLRATDTSGFVVRLYNINFIRVDFQIQHMMAFIDQEANEKAEEIDAKVR